MPKPPFTAVLLGAISLCGCSTDWVTGMLGDRNAAIAVSDAESARPAVLEPAPKNTAAEKPAAQEPVQVTALPEPRRARANQRSRADKSSQEPADPPVGIDQANRAARVQPRRADY